MRRNEAQTLLDEMVELHRQIAVKEMEMARLQDRLQGIREGLLSAFQEDMIPNPSPVGEPPVTDLEEVKSSLNGGMRNARKVTLRNTLTAEVKELESKTATCKFLGITPMTLDKAIREKGKYKEWNITVADTPGA